MYSETIAVFAPIGVLVLGGIVAWLLFWRGWDSYRKEPFGLMLMATIWGALFTWVYQYFLKSCNPTVITPLFWALTLLMEELIKAGALVNALECVGRKFEEKNDGIIYGAAAALGFGFVETLYYLQTATDFWAVYWGRLVYSLPAHMVFTGVFGMYYARAYLGEGLVGNGKKRKQPPFALLGNVLEAAVARVPQGKRNFWRVHWTILTEIIRLLTLHITRRHLVWGKPTRGHFAGELIIEGFVLAVYLHWAYDFALNATNEVYHGVALAGVAVLFGLLWWRFLALEKEAK